MAEWGFSLGAHGTGYLYAAENWNSTSQVSLHIRVRAVKDGAWYSGSGGSWNSNSYSFGTARSANSGAFNYIAGTQSYTFWEYDLTYDKDANGYITISLYAYVNGDNAPNVGAGSTQQYWTPARIGQGPAIADWTADTIKTTSARLGTEISNYGRGTSAAARMYYRIQGSGSAWSYTSDQNDAAGYNYWTVTGLKPGKTYEYYAYWWNNNTDVSQSAARTFKTKGIAGHTKLLLSMA